MGSSSSHHHYHEDKESKARAQAAEAAAAQAHELATQAQQNLEDQRIRNEELFRQQREAQERAQAESRRAQEDYQRQLREARQRQEAEAAAAAQRLEEERLETERLRQEAQREAAEAARRLEEEQAQRAAQAAEAARRLEEERLAAEQRLKDELARERARVHQERVDAWKGLNREYPLPEFLKAYVSEVLEDVDEDDEQDHFINIGILGDSGVGKSSLVREIMNHFDLIDGEATGERPVISFEGDGTLYPTRYQLNGFNGKVQLWDLPGQGTRLFPSSTYLRDMGLKYFDKVLIATDGRWSEGDNSLLQAVKFACVPWAGVRTKVDLAVRSGMKHHQLTQEECLDRVRAKLVDQLQENNPGKLFLVTTEREYWAGLHGGNKFGSIDDLCSKVGEYVEFRRLKQYNRRHGTPGEGDSNMADADSRAGDAESWIHAGDDEPEQKRARSEQPEPVLVGCPA
eukprot:TRINITY_DN23082_c0_g1_i4.p2 TRINITY_DN23082_c0_g1~~TRINITY_DN23082_c0_g1_i4.p2  ORF type:complete len:486 (+),score=135.91 TRINITY_DN23082_c0_g1_i4:86-1459(+)